MSDVLAVLRERIRAIEGAGAAAGILPFGVPAVDAVLPGGGLALAGLHEVLGAGRDEEDGSLAAAFAAGILGRLARCCGRPVLWCLAAEDLYAPGLAAHGLAPEQLILARCRGDGDILWAMEEGLRSGVLAAVLGEVGALPEIAGRRLQLAGESGRTAGFVLRRRATGGLAGSGRAASGTALTRWRVAAASARDIGEPGIGRPLWQVELMRCRGGIPAVWLMEEGDATGHVALAAELADRPAAPPDRRRAG